MSGKHESKRRRVRNYSLALLQALEPRILLDAWDDDSSDVSYSTDSWDTSGYDSSPADTQPSDTQPSDTGSSGTQPSDNSDNSGDSYNDNGDDTSDGYVDYSNTGCDTGPEVVYPPGRPGNLKLQAVSSTSIYASWTSGGGEDGFELDRMNPGGTFQTIATLNAGTTHYLDTGLQPGSIYSYAVVAFNSGGYSDYSNTATIMTVDTSDPTFVGQFGQISGGSASAPLSFRDADGTQVTVTLTGPGMGVLHLNPDGYDLSVAGTTVDSGLTISTVKSRTAGDDGRFDLANLVVGSPGVAGDDTALGTISATTTDLTGNLTITGPSRNITLGNLTGQDVLTIGTPAAGVASQGVTLTFDQVADATVSSGVGIQSLTATQWSGGEIAAPYLGALRVTGRGTAIAGDFDAGLNLSQGGFVGNELGSATIAGSVGGTNWDVQGKIGTIAISGKVGTATTPFTLTDATDIASLNLGEVTNAELGTSSKSLGNIGVLTTKAWHAGAVYAKTIGTLTVPGGRGIAGEFQADLTLAGAAIASANTLGYATIAGSVGGNTWTIQGKIGLLSIAGTVGTANTAFVLNANAATWINLGDVTDATVHITGTLGNLTAARWTSGSLEANVLNALVITGRTGIPGDFAANLLVDGTGVNAHNNALGTVSIAGAVGGETWTINGGLGSLSIAGTVGTANAAFVLNANAATWINLGDVTNAAVHVTGTLGNLTAARWTTGSLEANVLNSLWVTGKTGIPGDFAANVLLDGAGVSSRNYVLANATIAGTVGPATWDVHGKIGTITISGTVGTQAAAFVLKDATDIAAMNLGNVINTRLGETGTPLGQIGWIAAKAWTAGSLTAGTLGVLYITGGRTAAGGVIAGNVGADITLTGAPSRATTLSQVIVANQITGGTWQIAGGAAAISAKSANALMLTLSDTAAGAGNLTSLTLTDATATSANLQISANAVGTVNVLGSLSGSRITLRQAVSRALKALGQFLVRGQVTQSEIQSSGNIGTVSVGVLDHSKIFAGVLGSVTGLPAGAGDFVSTGTLPTIDYVRVTGYSVGPQAAAWIDSDVAAGTITVAALPNRTTAVLDVDMTGRFGFATVGTPVKSYTGPASTGNYVSGKDSKAA